MPIKDPIKRKEYHHKYMLEIWYPANRAKHIKLVAISKAKRLKKIKEYISSIKICCIKCGEDHPATLDFHHRDPSTKDFSLAHAIGSACSLEKIITEIAKCDVLCANCHRKVHNGL